jgi:hypothetical protein
LKEGRKEGRKEGKKDGKEKEGKEDKWNRCLHLVLGA